MSAQESYILSQNNKDVPQSWAESDVGFPEWANDWRLGVGYVCARLTNNLAQGNTSVRKHRRQPNQQSDTPS